MKKEYNFRGGVRGKYYRKYQGWSVVIDRRLTEMDAGKKKGRPIEVVIEELRAKLKRRKSTRAKN